MISYCTCLARFLPAGHSTLPVRCSELDQQDQANRKYGALVHRITAEGHLECSVKVNEKVAVCYQLSFFFRKFYLIV